MKKVTQKFLNALRDQAHAWHRDLSNVTDAELLQLIADGVGLLDSTPEDRTDLAAQHLNVIFNELAEDFSA